MENSIDKEKRAASLLLKRGVKVQILAPLFFRLFGKKKIDLTITAPTANTLLEIAHTYLSMRIEKTDELSIPEAFSLLKNHSRGMTDIIAISILNHPKKMWLKKILSRLLSNRLSQDTINYLFHLIVLYGGVEDFISTIRLVETTMITKPMNLSPEEKMS
jgi:hypothetical protein